MEWHYPERGLGAISNPNTIMLTPFHLALHLRPWPPFGLQMHQPTRFLCRFRLPILKNAFNPPCARVRQATVFPFTVDSFPVYFLAPPPSKRPKGGVSRAQPDYGRIVHSPSPQLLHFAPRIDA